VTQTHSALTLFCLLAISSITAGQETTLSEDTSARREIRAFCARAGKHLARNDIAAVAGMVPPETIIALKDGTTMTAAQAKSFALAIFPGFIVREGSFSTGTVSVNGNRASATIRSSCSFVPDGAKKTAPYRVASTWKASFELTGGKWLPKRFDQQSFSMTLNGKPVSLMPMPSVK